MEKEDNIKKIFIIIIFIYLQIQLFQKIKRPKVSVFLPIYNKEFYIKNCIESLQNQTLKDIEIIAINDGSTDNSLSMLRKFAKQDKRIKLVNNDRNHGLLYSRAMGVTNSTGEYLMNLDPDDKLINKDDLEELYKTAYLKKFDIIIYLIKRIAENESDAEYFKYLDENQLKMMDDHITNKFIKRDVFLKAYQEFEKEILSNVWNFHEDNVWSYLVKRNAKSISILNRYIYYYKRNKDSLNTKVGNEIELKNRFYRNKKFKEINYNNSFIFSLHHSLYDTNKFNKLLNNREIKSSIIHVLVDFLKLYSNRTIIYKKINLLLKKISENKIIIFYLSTSNKMINNICLLKLFKSNNIKNTYIISVNATDKNNIEDIKNYTYSNDYLIFLDNLIYKNEIRTLLDTRKNKKVFAFINDKGNKKIIENKNIKYICCK